MRDRQTELTYHPRELLSLDNIHSVLCVAPHPDDEVFGCGGLLALLAARGCSIQILILTRGESAQGEASDSHAAQRAAESVSAARLLGCPAPQFLEFGDRQLAYGPPLVQALDDACAEQLPQLLLLPSLSEPHPDHQAAALAGLALARQRGAGMSLLFYESGAPLHANVYVDITAVADKKWQAVAQFGSQLGIERYEDHARAFATLRAFGLPAACLAAEAFFRVDAQAVKEHGALAALPQWPWVRSSLQLANAPEQLPLVSVLIRSMDRPCLAEALASVALQTYSNLELIVVNASGHPHSALTYPGQRFQLTLVAPPDGQACGRAQAANLALQHSHGELALFLDDDDLLAPEHIEKLSAALAARPRAAGAYSGVRVEGPNGTLIRQYDTAWSRHRLEGINFLPIQAVLFRMDRVRQHGLRFDEQLPVLEDWDFWRQLSTDSELVHCPGVSAVYRQALGESGLGDAQHGNHWKLWHVQLLQRFVEQQPAAAVSRTLAWHAIELDRIESEHNQALQRLQTLQQNLSQTAALLDQQTLLAEQHLAARDALQRQLELFSLESQAALSAKEAQLQALAAETQVALSAKEAQLQALAAETQVALSAKEALQALAAETQVALAAKEQGLQAYALEVQAGFANKERQLQKLADDSVQQQQQLARVQAQLQHVLDSRTWRWSQALLRLLRPTRP